MSIHDNYTSIHDTVTDAAAERGNVINTSNTEHDNRSKSIVIQISLDDVFTQGRAKND